MMGDLSVVSRPLSREALLLSVGLALAEGRPARRHARRKIERIAASAHGLALIEIDALGSRTGRTEVSPALMVTISRVANCSSSLRRSST